MMKKGTLILVLALATFGYGQNSWDDNEITSIFDGIDVTAALDRVEAKGITPYDFGRDLLDMGYPDKAKEWYVAVGIHTKDLQYVYGLAWAKWYSGDNTGAINESIFIIAKDPTPIN